MSRLSRIRRLEVKTNTDDEVFFYSESEGVKHFSFNGLTFANDKQLPDEEFFLHVDNEMSKDAGFVLGLYNQCEMVELT